MNRSSLPLLLPAITLVLLPGCNRTSERPVAPTQAVTPSAQMPFSVGTVLETMDASTYTYVRVKTAQGEIWAASNKFAVKVGDRVAVPTDGPMENFRSPSLNRTFPILFMTSRIFRQGDPDSPIKIS